MGKDLNLVALDAQSTRYTLSVFRTGTPGCRTFGSNDTFVVRIVAGNAGQLAVFAQREYNAELFFHCLHAGQGLDRRSNHQMIDVSGVLSSNDMTPPANHSKISNEFDIFISRLIFLRQIGMAI